jgi:hypothetical protein
MYLYKDAKYLLEQLLEKGFNMSSVFIGELLYSNQMLDES